MLGITRTLAILGSVLLLASGTSAATAAETTSYGPFSPPDDPLVTVSGTITVDGDALELVTTLSRPTSHDFCFTAQRRWVGPSAPADPISTCGSGIGGSFSITAMMSPLPESIDLRVCSGANETLDENLCTAWTRIYTGPDATPTTPSKQKWGPVKAKRGLAVAKGSIKGDKISVVLSDRAQGPRRCAWAVLTVKAADGKSKERMWTCRRRAATVKEYPGLSEARIKVCSGSKKRPKARTCRTRTL